MGRGIDRTGPNGDYYISSSVTIVDHYSYEDDPYGDFWLDDIEASIVGGMDGKWSKPKEKEWIGSDGWSHRDYYVIARHEGSLDAAIVASTDTDHHGEFFVVVKRDRCDNAGIEALAERMVRKWCAKLHEALRPMGPRMATSSWTSTQIFSAEQEVSQ